ncbi:MAG: AAA family ATPase [Planctomycetes bacterium]|nr:AAA family ATPase [Planctomycetota bacterium]
MTRLYIAATQQHDGKTTTSLGLIKLFTSMGKKVHFIKPVGQRYMEMDGHRIDEDAVLMQHVFGSDNISLAAMSPVAVPRGFTEEYIFNRDPKHIYDEIDRAVSEVDKDVDVTIVEGTGHAGVGSVFDASNADVAKHIGAKAIIVSGGGIGRCIDEICLNRALFEQAGVPVIGAIINKVLEAKYDKVSRAVRQGLDNKGLKCLGVIPYCQELTFPTISQLQDELSLTVLSGEDYMGMRATSVIVAAMGPVNTIGFIKKGTFVITPGDRIDNILMSVAAHLVSREQEEAAVSGILLSGGFIPHFTILNLLKQAHVPVLSCSEDTYTISSKIQKFVVKIGVGDDDKVAKACSLIADNVDGNAILDKLSGG